MINVTILTDFRITDDLNFWLKAELDKLGFNTRLLGIQDYNANDEKTGIGKIKTWYKYFRLSVQGIKKSRKNEVIISDNFVIGAITAFLCKIFGIKRKIIAINLIAHQKGFINRVIRKLVYNTAFKYDGFRFSVNDKELIETYSKEFHFPKDRIFVLHDSISGIHEENGFEDNGEFVFTGGDAFRDWRSFIKCAEDMPGIQFVGVARYKYFPNSRPLPKNLKMFFDIPSAEFYSLVKKSRIVFLPLTSLAPCGLIVMMKAALLSKPVIITETPSTKNYVANEISGRLVKINDVNDMKTSIQSLYNSRELRLKYSENLKKYLLEHFSDEKNAQIISNVIMN